MSPPPPGRLTFGGGRVWMGGMMDSEVGDGPSAIAREAALRKIEEARRRAIDTSGWYGTRILLFRECRRFLRMASQTLVSPALVTMLYFVIFGYTLGARLREVGGVPYVDFLVPGLIMLNIINSAYLNAGFSLFMGKVHGSVVDLLVTPLTPLQFMAGYLGASVLRAMAIGAVIWVVAALMGAGTVYNPAITLVFMVLTALAFGQLGLIVAVLARDFDDVNFLPSFCLMPLTFLGGVFYSIDMLPDFWAKVSLFNPILYMVNGLRYGMTGVSDVPVTHGFVLIGFCVAVFGVVSAWLLASGKKLREGQL